MLGLLNAISCGKIHGPVTGANSELGEDDSLRSEPTKLTNSNKIRHEPPRSPGLPAIATLSPVVDHKDRAYNLDPSSAGVSASAGAPTSSSQTKPEPQTADHNSVALQPPTPVDPPPIFSFGSAYSPPEEMLPEDERQGRSQLVQSPAISTDNQFGQPSPNLTLRTPGAGSPVRK